MSSLKAIGVWVLRGLLWLVFDLNSGRPFRATVDVRDLRLAPRGGHLLAAWTEDAVSAGCSGSVTRLRLGPFAVHALQDLLGVLDVTLSLIALALAFSADAVGVALLTMMGAPEAPLG
eukprot:CAMPEP_0170639348 /NCGR_PEP_ID=MMETSP0224-20130122/39598_1 /TAXON_ID=285029 /ORGANISM="Togula jolla, Strain CCCM 725" /LENGTH=117 /DNA_ID=CAMNT_0010969691 /DNA_START=237 /DNA_END=587 /DNA_ORIENTATION=-